METWHTLIEIVILLVAALACGVIAEQLRQHAIVGYLVAGALVGPNAIGWVKTSEDVAQIAELGVALLLFSIGLEFSIPRLRRMGRIALVGGPLQILLTTVLFAAGAAVLGMDAAPAIGIGLMVALSSTACVLRLLADRAEIDTMHGRNTVGVLLMQDVAVVPAVLLISILAGEGGLIDALKSVGLAVGLGAVMVGGFYILFNVLAPRVMVLRQLVRNRELPVLLAVVMALGSTVIAHELGLSPALGAFAAGLLLAGSPFAPQIRSDVGPLKTVLVTLFFASIGMLFNPLWAAGHWHWVLGTVVAVIVGKALVLYAIVRLLRMPGGIALATGLALAQIGEFSFVLVDLAYGGELISRDIFRLIVAVTMFTLLLTPYMVRFAPAVAVWFERKRPSIDHGANAAADQTRRRPTADHIVLIGFGPAGQRIATRLLRDFRDRLLVVDINPRNLKMAESYGIAAQHGDATAPDLLEHIHLDQARALVVTLPDVAATRQIIHLAKQTSPHVPIIARARYHVFLYELILAGAEAVVDEEDHLGKRMAAEVWRRVTHGEPPQNTTEQQP